MKRFAVRANAFHAPERGRIETLSDVLIEVSANGTIAAIGPATPERLKIFRDSALLIDCPQDEYLLPGLVDLHVHAPQWPQLGKALEVPLEDWLQRHTFPLEARYADAAFSLDVYSDLVDTLLKHGTTTAVYFATIHIEATVALAEICLAKGQRALIGKVAMDDPATCPDYYRDCDASSAIAGTRGVIDRITALQPGGNPLVRPAITPRFLPSCTNALLEGLGRLAAETGVHVQTHCSESDWEVAYSHARFGRTDAEVLDHFGLLRPHTILAHGNFTTKADRTRIGRAQAAFAHCPLSNAYFAGEILPSRHILADGLRIGLGTDISGGYSPSVLESARFAVTASRMLDRCQPGSKLSVADAFWMATAGGGEALGLPIGQFRPGYAFDAILVSSHTEGFRPSNDTEGPHDIIERIIRLAGAQAIKTVWVQGKQVHLS